VPGLINAYKTATADALKFATKIEKWIEEIIEITFDYPTMSEVMYLLKQGEAIVYEQELQLFCRVVAGMPRKHASLYIA